MLNRILENWKQKKSIKIYGEYYLEHKAVITELLSFYLANQEKVAIWGAGLKGIAFLQVFDPTGKFVQYVYDIDKNKHGTKLESGHAIVDYKEKQYQDIQIVLVMNSNYETDIAGKLRKESMHVKLVNLNNIIYGNLDLQEILEMYGGCLS